MKNSASIRLSKAAALFYENKRPHTERAYAYVWADWQDYVEPRGQLEAPGMEVTIGYLNYIRNETLPYGEKAADSTVRHRFNVLHAYYEFFCANELARFNPFKRIRHTISWRQQIQKRPTQLIPPDEISAIIESMPENSKKEIMLMAIISLFFGTGMRASEVLYLNVGDVMTTHSGTPFVRIRHDKGGKGRDVAIPGFAFEAFSKFVAQRKSEGADSGDPLWVRYYKNGKTHGRRICAKTLYRLYKETTGVAPHSARASMASQLKVQGYEDRIVGEALGHATSTMVVTYDKRRRGVDQSPLLRLDYDFSS